MLAPKRVKWAMTIATASADEHDDRRARQEAIAGQRNAGRSEGGDERMPNRHRIQVDHEAAAAQQEQAGEGDDERLNLAKVDDQPLQRAEGQAETQHHRGRGERMPAERVEIGHHHADETDHRSDRQVDAAAENDEGGANGGDDDEGVVGQDVAEDQRRQEVVVEKASGDEQRQEHGDRGKKRQVFLAHRSLPPKPLDRVRRRLPDCSRRTTMTTIALTTRLYSGGRPLVRIEVVSA